MLVSTAYAAYYCFSSPIAHFSFQFGSLLTHDSLNIAQHATATPIRVIFTEVTTFHPSAVDSNVAHIENEGAGLLMPPAPIVLSGEEKEFHDHHNAHAHSDSHGDEEKAPHHKAHRKPCAMKKIKESGVAISNAFRQALGLPLIEKNISPAEAEKLVHGGLLRIMPNHHIGDDEHKGEKGKKGGKWHHVGDDEKKAHHHEHDSEGQVEKHHAHHAHHHKGAHAHHHMHHASFMRRIHRALAGLGPWEGRAVAFVIGCGLGVLMRMFWVLAVVAVRFVRGGRNDEEVEYREILLVTDAEDVIVAPPHYEYVDEKRPIEKEEIEQQKTAKV